MHPAQYANLSCLHNFSHSFFYSFLLRRIKLKLYNTLNSTVLFYHLGSQGCWYLVLYLSIFEICSFYYSIFIFVQHICLLLGLWAFFQQFRWLFQEGWSVLLLQWWFQVFCYWSKLGHSSHTLFSYIHSVYIRTVRSLKALLGFGKFDTFLAGACFSDQTARNTVCWNEFKVAVLCARQYMSWNLLLIWFD